MTSSYWKHLRLGIDSDWVPFFGMEVPKPNSATFGMARANGRICDPWKWTNPVPATPLRFAAAMLLPLAVRNDSDFQEIGLAKIGDPPILIIVFPITHWIPLVN